MKTHFSIKSHTVHLWHIVLSDFTREEQQLSELLNTAEMDRANQFHFAIHRQRFVIARAMLRRILSLYTNQLPADIVFAYGHKGKPYLPENSLKLQFNVSHSEDMAVYAITTIHEIGVDIEKVEAEFKGGIAKRFFSERENALLEVLPDAEKSKAFYRIWSRKEALIKAIGEGLLYSPLHTFSVGIENTPEFILLSQAGREVQLYLTSFDVDANYQSAFATLQTVEAIVHWQWLQKGPILLEK